jgi:hypothetical protein
MVVQVVKLKEQSKEKHWTFETLDSGGTAILTKV